eukprot:scaffold4384_cov367-Prasinococcus_capsulatus_cf.AAC.12
MSSKGGMKRIGHVKQTFEPVTSLGAVAEAKCGEPSHAFADVTGVPYNSTTTSPGWILYFCANVIFTPRNTASLFPYALTPTLKYSSVNSYLNAKTCGCYKTLCIWWSSEIYESKCAGRRASGMCNRQGFSPVKLICCDPTLEADIAAKLEVAESDANSTCAT